MSSQIFDNVCGNFQVKVVFQIYLPKINLKVLYIIKEFQNSLTYDYLLIHTYNIKYIFHNCKIIVDCNYSYEIKICFTKIKFLEWNNYFLFVI